MRFFLRDERASVITLGALLLPVLLACGAFAVDLANLYRNQGTIQRAADAAALGSVLLLPNATDATSRALDLVTANAPAQFGSLSGTQDITIGTWDLSTKTFTPGLVNPNAVRVATHRTTANGNPIETAFGKFVGHPQLQTSAQAIAVRFGGACVRILDPNASGAFTRGGSGQVNMNCALQVNSSSPTAAQSKGSATISTSATCVTGGYKGNGWTPLPTTGCDVLGDPLAAIPEPVAPACVVDNPTIVSGTAASNCTYTGTVSLGGTVKLQSGLYYFKGATIKVAGSTNISGSGITIFLDANSTLDLSGSGTIDVSAVATGTHAGILIFQSRSTPSSRALSIGGTGDLMLNGTLYVPSATLSLSGNATSSNASKIGYAIANQMVLGGSSSFTFNAFPTSGVNPRTMAVHAGLVR